MNQLVCPTDISSGVGGCAKMHLKMGVAGARSKVGRAKGVNPHGTLVPIWGLGVFPVIVRQPRKPPQI